MLFSIIFPFKYGKLGPFLLYDRQQLSTVLYVVSLYIIPYLSIYIRNNFTPPWRKFKCAYSNIWDKEVVSGKRVNRNYK